MRNSGPCYELVARASRRVGWMEFIIPLIPIFAELLVDILNDCAQTEDDALDLASASPAVLLLFRRKVAAKLRVERPELSRRERRRATWQVSRSIVDEAAENDRAVVACFAESRSAA